jgi:hypothetical protein
MALLTLQAVVSLVSLGYAKPDHGFCGVSRLLVDRRKIIAFAYRVCCADGRM